MELYLLSPKTQSCFGHGTGLKVVKHPRECIECLWMNSEDRKKKVDVVLYNHPPKAALCVAKPPGVCLMLKDMAKLFDDMTKHISFGRVYLKDGTLFDEYVSVTSKSRKIIRGFEGSSLIKCEECGRYGYFSQYPWYVLEPSEEPISESWPMNGFVVHKDIIKRIEKKQWKGFYISKLPIEKNAKDGIHAFPLLLGDMK